VLNNGTLTVDRSDAVTLAGGISGTGGLVQAGAGTTSLAINVSSLLSNVINVDSDLAAVAGNVTTILAGTTSIAIGVSSLLSNVVALNVLATSILVDTGTSLPAQVAALNNLSAAQHSATLASALAWLWRRRCG
jgi:hypothetical protein